MIALPPLAVSLGDPAGIGPEIVAKAWAAREAAGLMPFFAIGDARSIEAVWPGPVVRIAHPDAAAAAFAVALPVIEVQDAGAIVPGAPDLAGARCALDALELGVGLARSGEAAAIVTGPVSKSQLYAIGFSHPGQTEFVAERCGIARENVAMMLAGPTLRAVPVTTHVPLVKVRELLSIDLIVARARILWRGLVRDFGIPAPRIAVAGFNPHAGEGGALGMEEIELIQPAMERLSAEGIDLIGPLSADTMFHARARAQYDAALCLYHDQALIPLKTLHFDEGVNMTLGLPIVRTAPDHGTAFGLAGRDEAEPGAMIAAIALAGQCARRRTAAAAEGMTPAARAQAAIDILDEVVAAARDAGPAADTIVARYFKARRYAGSKDRKAVRALVYAAIRRAGSVRTAAAPPLIGLARKDPVLRALFDGSPHGPAPIAKDETGAPGGIAPKWLEKKLNDALGRDALPALLERAPLDLRVNILATTRDEMIAAFPGAAPTPHAIDGLRLAEAIQIETSDAFLNGLVEVQDEGSQLLALTVAPAPGEIVIDLCAGAGGKTLALAAAMGNFGQIIAADTDRGRLQRLEPRALRAGVSIVETRLLNPGEEAKALADLTGQADAVLIDAPCSGTGTWRRNPEARWRLTPERLERLTALQSRLIALGATLAKPGGSLTYGVCSLLPEEGPAVADAFLKAHPGWTEAERRRLHPASDGTDGFFFARFIRPC